MEFVFLVTLDLLGTFSLLPFVHHCHIMGPKMRENKTKAGPSRGSREPNVDTMGVENLSIQHKKKWERLTATGRKI